MTETHQPPRFHVVSVWHDPPSPEVERHRESPAPRPPLPPETTADPRSPRSEPVPPPEPALTVSTPPDPAPPRTSLRGPGLYDLPGLLTRIWSAPAHHSAALAPVGPKSAPQTGTGGASIAPESRLVPGVYTPYEVPTRPIFLTPEAYASPLPRRTRPWICPSCQLPNAPWSRNCTSCRTAAP